MTGPDFSNPSAPRYQRSRLIKVPHGMFTRHDGTSLPPFSSLNVGYGVGDDPSFIAANRQRLKQFLGIPFLLSAKQVHEDRIFCASNITADTEVEGYDALITDQLGVGLLIQQADCQALLMHDPDKQVIAAVHCGWRGSVANIIKLTISEMERRYQTDPTDLLVAISPSLGPCCAEFINYRQELPEQLHCFQETPYHFNFWEISMHQLIEAGVMAEHVDIAHICTSCDRDYFSYRRTSKGGKVTTGRNGSVILLPLASSAQPL